MPKVNSNQFDTSVQNRKNNRNYLTMFEEYIKWLKKLVSQSVKRAFPCRDKVISKYLQSIVKIIELKCTEFQTKALVATQILRKKIVNILQQGYEFW